MNLTEALFETIKFEVQSRFRGAKGSHDWEHTERVLALAERIGADEGADLGIVRLATVLHDIGRAEEDLSNGTLDHAARGAELARTLLGRHHLEPAVIDAVAHCISTHRFRKGPAPETLEAKVLFDADKLDAIGAVGIGRAFLFAGEVGAKLHNPRPDIEETPAYSPEDTAYREYRVKLRHVRERILTASGKRLAEERHAFMESFFNRLDQEISGTL
ncbi:MAG: HD domain-containing protein [candidate division FCPU426 bacterium]